MRTRTGTGPGDNVLPGRECWFKAARQGDNVVSSWQYVIRGMCRTCRPELARSSPGADRGYRRLHRDTGAWISHLHLRPLVLQPDAISAEDGGHRQKISIYRADLNDKFWTYWRVERVSGKVIIFFFCGDTSISMENTFSHVRVDN